MTRREVIASATFVPLAALTTGATAAAQTPAGALSPAQIKTLDAFMDRLCPKDESGAGAVECGASAYIDRALAGPNAAEKATLTDGLATLDTLARAAGGASFAELTGEKRDAIITALETGAAGTVATFPAGRAFFTRVRRLMLEGMFSDPYYGGNKNFAGWDLIHYPGPRLAVAAEDQRMSVAPTPYRVSAWGKAAEGKGSEHGH